MWECGGFYTCFIIIFMLGLIYWFLYWWGYVLYMSVVDFINALNIIHGMILERFLVYFVTFLLKHRGKFWDAGLKKSGLEHLFDRFSVYRLKYPHI